MTGGLMLKAKVEEALDKVRAGLKAEGGDIELVDVRDTVVYVRLKGACGTCPMSALTMKSWVESSIKKEIPEITAVQAV
jgi:Fe-S cluster biogenesis protein NfuA